MNRIKGLYYLFRYDIVRNFWIRNIDKSNLWGIAMVFHHITNENVDALPSCKCNIEDFNDILLNYKRNGYEFVSIKTALDYIANKRKRKFVVITFDDIPENVYTNAYPILKKLKIPFAVFITYNFLDKDSYLKKQELVTLSNDSLCTIGAHTMNHSNLRNDKNSQTEIIESKRQIEETIRKKIDYFAYPYGRFDSVSSLNVREVKLAGFTCAFSTIDAPLTSRSSRNLFFLPRIVPEKGHIDEFQPSWGAFSKLKVLWSRK